MSVESIESTARRVSFEMGVEAVKLVGPLSNLLWAASRALVTKALTTVPGRGGSMGGRVSTVDLEKFTNGQRAIVNLEDPRTFRVVRQTLRRYGVTFAVTKEAGEFRVHIGAGNAALLDAAMKHAESTVARQIQREQDRAAKREAATPQRRTTTPERTADRVVDRTVPSQTRQPDAAPAREVAREAVGPVAGRSRAAGVVSRTDGPEVPANFARMSLEQRTLYLARQRATGARTGEARPRGAARSAPVRAGRSTPARTASRTPRGPR